jgi:hypothetical protein
MTFPVTNRDPGNLSGGRITKNGEAVVGQLEYSEPYTAALAVDDQVYNVAPAITGKRFVITAAIVGAGRDVSTDTAIVVYEALSEDTQTINKLIWAGDLDKGGIIAMTGLNVATQSTRWINAYCDDNTVGVTLFGYYVDA